MSIRAVDAVRAQNPVVSEKFALLPLAARLVGSMIHGGAFSLPRSIAKSASPRRCPERMGAAEPTIEAWGDPFGTCAKLPLSWSQAYLALQGQHHPLR